MGTKLGDLASVQHHKFELNIEKRQMEKYLHAHGGKNWYSKKRIRVIGKQIRKEIDVDIAKLEIELTDLNKQIENLVPSEAYTLWACKYFEQMNANENANMASLIMWVDMK